MVLAGAGSGKTRVITRRIARLLRDGVPPWSVLALTFTNKAADEMRRRVQDLGGDTVAVATFHSACARFLRQDAERLDYPRGFTIYDTYDRDQCLRMVAEEHGLDLQRVRPADLGRAISRLKNVRVRPAEFRPGHGELDRCVSLVYGPYEARMRRQGAMDFDDLLLNFLDLLEQHPEAAQAYQQRFRWVLVDEFQDTNLVQYQLLRQLCREHQNLCVVGDPDQSIYRFRGAEVRNMLEFQRDFPGTAVVRLETNYRSTPQIVHAAEAVIANNHMRLEKALHTENEPGEPIAVLRAPSPDAEAAAVAAGVRERLQDGASPADVAVFYRTHFLSRAVEEAFRGEGIPYVVVGGVSFFERREIKDLLAYLRAAVNPLDDVSFERILNVPARGFGKAALARLREAANQRACSLLEAVRDPEVRALLAGKARRGAESLASLYEELFTEVAHGAATSLGLVLERTGYREYACGLGDPEDVARSENIDELLTHATNYDAEHAGEGLPGYLQRVSLVTAEEEQGEPKGPRVSLMTVHAAKGLEFDHVYVVGMEEDLFPHSRAAGSDEDLEEERRLLYVAITRARRSVQLSHAAYRTVGGSIRHALPSPFLKELPAEVVARHGAADLRIESQDAEWEGSQETPDLECGARVRHPVYGEGVVLDVSGAGIRTRARIRFRDGAERTVLLDYVRLQILPPRGATW